jgi:cytochrome c oxidase subunit IV
MEHSADNGAAARKNIYKTTAILAAITTLEFIIAFGMTGESMYAIKVSLFVLLTIVKAYYIVAIFMHLGDEAKRLIWAISIPFAFLVWLLLAMGKEGNSYGHLTTFKGNEQPQAMPIEDTHKPAAHDEHAAPATELNHDSTENKQHATDTIKHDAKAAEKVAPAKEAKKEEAKPAAKADKKAAEAPAKEKAAQSKVAPAKVEKKGK